MNRALIDLKDLRRRPMWTISPLDLLGNVQFECKIRINCSVSKLTLLGALRPFWIVSRRVAFTNRPARELTLVDDPPKRRYCDSTQENIPLATNVDTSHNYATVHRRKRKPLRKKELRKGRTEKNTGEQNYRPPGWGARRNPPQPDRRASSEDFLRSGSCNGCLKCGAGGS